MMLSADANTMMNAPIPKCAREEIVSMPVAWRNAVLMLNVCPGITMHNVPVLKDTKEVHELNVESLPMSNRNHLLPNVPPMMIVLTIRPAAMNVVSIHASKNRVVVVPTVMSRIDKRYAAARRIILVIQNKDVCHVSYPNEQYAFKLII